MEQEQLEKNRKEVPQPFQPQINLSYKDTRTHQVTCIEDRTIKQFINQQQQWNNKREQTQKLKLFQKEQQFKEANTFQPKINGNSKKIFSTKVKTDQSFSEPVEERLNKKRQETNEKHKLKTQITNCYTFVPTINQNSKRLAQKFRDSKQNISAINLKKNSIYNLDQSQKSFYSNNMRQSSSFDIKNSIPDRKYSYNIIISRESQPLFSQSFFQQSEQQNLSTSQMVSNASMNQPTQDSTTTYPNVDLSNLSFSQNQNLLQPQDSIAQDQESSSFMLLKDQDISLQENNQGSSSSQNTQRINNKVKQNVSKKPSKFVKQNASASKHRDLSNTERSKAKTEKKSKELVNEVEYSPNIDFILNILNKSKMLAQLNYENLNSDNSHAIK